MAAANDLDWKGSFMWFREQQKLLLYVNAMWAIYQSNKVTMQLLLVLNLTGWNSGISHNHISNLCPDGLYRCELARYL